MIDIYNIPLYYIGFKKNPKLEEQLEKVGFKNINYFKAIEGRKMNVEKLLKDGIIAERSYNDLMYNREEHIGISSLGTIGCTLSHLELWKLCSHNFPYIIIAEDDVKPKEISESDKINIENALKKTNGCFISTSLKKNHKTLMGLHFYFLSNGAAKGLSKKALPINMQTDSYVGYLNNIGDINADGYKVFSTYRRITSTGDMCIKCFLPSGGKFYILFILFIICLIICSFVFFTKWTKTKYELDSCRNSSL